MPIKGHDGGPNADELRAIWNAKKEYIDGDLWVIRNFLSQEELDWIMQEARKPEHWYITMRSLYKNIANKYLDVIPEYNEDGILVSQFYENPPMKKIPYFYDENGINNRLAVVLPEVFPGTTTLQTFLSIREDDEEMVALAKEVGAKENNESFRYHSEAHDENPDSKEKLTASFSIYLNDDFEGGELFFKYKPDIVIKPEPGMLVNIPLTEDFTHKIGFVSGGDRHTLYGNCWKDIKDFPISTMEDC